MFCTNKEQETCQVEKMGCKGCYYYNDKNEPFTSKLIKKYCKCLVKKMFGNMIKARRFLKKPEFRYCIETSKIKISDSFIKTPPKKYKMAERWRYYRETGELYSPIVINNDGYLIDGYTSYLIAIAENMKFVDVRLSEGR